MYPKRGCLAAAALLLIAAVSAQGAEPVGLDEKVELIQTSRSIAIGLRDFDMVRRAAPDLKAIVFLRDDGNKLLDTFMLDYARPAAQSHVVFHKRPGGDYARVEIQFVWANGASTVKRALPPVTESAGRVALTEETAHLEPGTAFDKGAAPAIRLPDFTQAAGVELATAPRTVDMAVVRHRVTADYNFPIVGWTCFVLPRSGPDAPKGWSIYITMNNDLYDLKTGAHDSPFKYIIELPVDPEWVKAPGDQTVSVPWQKVQVHMTTEEIDIRRLGRRRITGHKKGLLGHGSNAVDEDGNIYFPMLYGSPIRFNVKKAKWEATPVNIYDFHLQHKPKPADLPYTKEEGIEAIRTDFSNRIAYHNGRIWVFIRRNGIYGDSLLLASVVSIPVKHWDNPKAFEAAIRFNAGSYPTATFPLWDTYPRKEDHRRTLKWMAASGNRIYMLSYHRNYFWVMEVADDGTTTKLTPVKTLGGKPIEDIAPQMKWVIRDGTIIGIEVLARAKGDKKSRPAFLPGDGYTFTDTFPEKTTRRPIGFGARGFLSNPAGMYGKIGTNKGDFSRRIGAPYRSGKLTIYYDSVTKMIREPGAFADVIAKMRAASMGPEYYVVPAPGDTMEVLGVADYPKYNFGRYNCAPGVKTIKRNFLIQQLDVPDVRLGLPAKLGPYCHRWVREGADDVLYYAGYTGVARLRYRTEGMLPERHNVQMLFAGGDKHACVDGAPDAYIKWYRDMWPGLGDKIFVTGLNQISRGGTAYSGGLMYFHRRTPNRLFKLSEMSRCYNTGMLAGRLCAEPGGRLAQDILLGGNHNYAAPETLPAEKRHTNIQPRIFVYRDGGADGVQDRFGFTLQPAEGKAPGLRDITMAANGLYLLVLMSDGALATFDMDAMRFVDAVRVPPPFASFRHGRGNASFLNLPDGSRMLGLLEKKDPDDAEETPKAGAFVRIDVDSAGRISLTPHLRCTFASPLVFGAPVAFVYDARNNDGSYDAVFGPHSKRPEGALRIIRDFVTPRR